MKPSEHQFQAWEIFPRPDVALEPAPVERDWMDAIHLRFAYRCLPLVVANQSGWILRSPEKVTVRWNGGSQIKDLRVWLPKKSQQRGILSHFGAGILTFTVPFLFRTPPGINLSLLKWPSGSTRCL